MYSQTYRTCYSLVIRGWSQCSQLLPAIAAAGFEGIEPTFVAGALPDPTSAVRSAGELNRLCRDLGIVVPSMRCGTVPWDTIPSPDRAERQRAVDHMRLAMDALAEMGGTTLLVVPGRRTPLVDYRDHWQRVVEFCRIVAPAAADRGMRIGLENVEARFPSSERDWVDLLAEIDSAAVGIYLDVGNVLWMGFGYPEQWIESLGRHIVQVHFKDASYRLDGTTLHAQIRQLLDGEVNWPAVMAALRRVGYTGWIGVEPEWYRHAPQRLPQRLAQDLAAIFALETRSGEAT